MTDNAQNDTNTTDGDGGAASAAPPPLGGNIPTPPVQPDPAAAAQAYSDTEAATGSAGEPSEVAADDVDLDGLPLGHDATPDELRQRLEQAEMAVLLLETERDEYRSDLQRKAAELSNVLKREQRNAGVGRLEGRMDVMRSLLDVLDDFERTMQAAATSEDEGLRSGISLVHGKFSTAMAAQGLVRTGEVGEPFDPNRHEAVQQIEAEDGPLESPIVHEIYRPGYLVGDRVLRAAMVVVAQ